MVLLVPDAGDGADRRTCGLYNEKVDLFIDGKLVERPITHFAGAAPAASRRA